METVGTFEAKTHLSELLDRVGQGQTITITRHGIPAAMLVPVGSTEQKLTHQEVVEQMRALRQRLPKDNISLRELIEEGRRY